MAQSFQDNTHHIHPLPSSPQQSISITVKCPNSSFYACFSLGGEGRKNLVPRNGILTAIPNLSCNGLDLLDLDLLDLDPY